ncbi:MAG TPA: UDP-N-acetylglucosamine 1-carboxyvinyltransferase [Clostridiales bacterium]|nr:UDP-N-acetylglucosamine 1-carboxyvinyltransferase [Clostridiales bacterium]
MSKLIIRGGKELAGSVKISGAKNSAVAVIAATILCHGTTILENVPQISDVKILLNIMKNLGISVDWLEDDTVAITVPEDIKYAALYEEVSSLRASNLLLGSLLGRRGNAAVALPGGCDLGERPMDLHIKGFTKLGAVVNTPGNYIEAKISGDGLTGNFIYLDFPSVGATENIMMTASVAAGQTIIENVAKEPEIVDLANFLNNAGAKIRGAGTDIIKIEGVKELYGCRHSIIPDRIEAGTFMAIAAVTGSQLKLENVIAAHMTPVIAKMRETGTIIRPAGNHIFVKGPEKLLSISVVTLAHPGFPTDMQPQMMAMASLAEGTSTIEENIFEKRMKAASELTKMGADITVNGKNAVVRGVDQLHGATVMTHDLRAGAALVAAALAADDETVVEGMGIIDRGYWHMEEKLKAIGADVRRREE